MSNNDTVRPGPQRWKRAVDAALAKPESYHADLLFERLNRVKDLNPAPAYWVVEKFDRRQYYCSDFCTGLGMHLAAYVGDHMNFSTYDEVIAAIVGCRENDVIHIGWTGRSNGPALHPLDPEDLPRTVKCFTCGGRMSRLTETSDDPLVDFTYALALAKAYARPVTEVTLSDTPQLADWERELLDTAQEELKIEKKKTVYIADDGTIFDERPVYRPVSLTKNELSLLERVPVYDRRTVLEDMNLL